MSSEESCRAGACPRRSRRFVFSVGRGLSDAPPLPSIFCRGFRRLRAASYFAHGGKVTKTPPGTAPDEHFVLIVAFPRTPIYGGYPLGWAESFRRAKSEWRSAVSPGPLGPGFAKIRTGAVPLPRLPLPNQRSRCEFWRAHAMRPYWFRTVGAAISRPKAFPFGGRCPRRGRMRCAAKGRLRAGQCPAPTERPERSPYFAGAGVLTRPPGLGWLNRRGGTLGSPPTG